MNIFKEVMEMLEEQTGWEICLLGSFPKCRGLNCGLSPTTLSLSRLKSPLPAGATLTEVGTESTTVSGHHFPLLSYSFHFITPDLPSLIFYLLPINAILLYLPSLQSTLKLFETRWDEPIKF